MGSLFYLSFLIVLVTGLLQHGDGETANSDIKPAKMTSSSKIIRFFGNSFIVYSLDTLPAESLAATANESLSMKFFTQDSDGILLILKESDRQIIRISIKDGDIVFVVDDGRNPSQTMRVQSQGARPLNNAEWHTLKLEKDGRTLKFYVDNIYVTQMTTTSEVQFLQRGTLFLGGVAKSVLGDGFEGDLTDVEIARVFGPSKKSFFVSFFQDSIASAGNIEVINQDQWSSQTRNWSKPIVTSPPPPEFQVPITFTSRSSVLILKETLDMSSGGSLSFDFQTLEPHGLLVLAQASAQISNYFFAIEISDGNLYFIYNLGTISGRKQFQSRIDNGEWHQVTMTVGGSNITLSLDRSLLQTVVTRDEMLKMIFYRLLLGGSDDFARVPWTLNSRHGYKGCLRLLKINNKGVELSNSNIIQTTQGIETGCRSTTLFCREQPCLTGYCKDRMDGYVCDCANTPYSGINCSTAAVTAAWDGTLSTTYRLKNRDVNHNNDISIRFMTPLADTLLFKTEADNKEDYIHGELDKGRAKVTIKVDGKIRTFVTGGNLNDYSWHTLYIRRRGDDMTIWVDNESMIVGIIGGKDYQFYIDRIKLGSVGTTGTLSESNYIGYMQNFMFNNIELLSLMKTQNMKINWTANITSDNLTQLIYRPITITASTAYFQLPALQNDVRMKINFKFKTIESNGLILYNGGTKNDPIAIELFTGKIRLAYNLGGQNVFTVPTTNQLNDNKWHSVQVGSNERGQFTVKVDDTSIHTSTSGSDGRLSLTGHLYIGGVPESMYTSQALRSLIESRKGFKGCLASVNLNGTVPELKKYANNTADVLTGCNELVVVCKPDTCGLGLCLPSGAGFYCDCNMTGYVGTTCTNNPEGYYFGKNGGKGIMIYEFPFEKQTNTTTDEIAFGFMTEQDNAVLYRIEGNKDSGEYIEIRLENGYIFADSSTGSGLISISEQAQRFNDGQYHTLRYIRTGRNSTLQVDKLENKIAHTGALSVFDNIYAVLLGGKRDARGSQIMNFNGIIGGAYYNGYRWMDMLLGQQPLYGKLVQMNDDIVLAKSFLLVKAGGATTHVPPDVIIPPNGEVPVDIGGMGIIGSGIGGSGGGAQSEFLEIGGLGGLTAISGGIGLNVPGEPVPLAAASIGLASPSLGTGTRAGAVVGTVLGTLAFLTSLMWALYQLKPGIPTCLSPGASVVGSGDGMSISSPQAASNIGAVKAVSAAGSATGAGAGVGVSKVTVVNRLASGGTSAGGGGSSYTSYIQSSSAAVAGGGGGGTGIVAGGADIMDASSTLQSSGAFSNQGAVFGSPNVPRVHLGSSASGYSAKYQSNTINSYGSSGGTMGRGYDRQYMVSTSDAGIPDYDLPVAGTMHSGHSSSTLNTHYNYQAMGTNTSKSTCLEAQTNTNTHKSVLSIILASGKTAPVPTHHEIFSSKFAPARNQGFVDRSEDMIVEDVPTTIRITLYQLNAIKDDKSESSTSSSGVLLHTGAFPFANYKPSATTDYNTHVDSQRTAPRSNHKSSRYGLMDNSYTKSTGSNIVKSSTNLSKTDVYSSERKASLQITPFANPKKGGYKQLESCNSETNIDIDSLIEGINRKRTDRVDKHIDVSRDTLYASVDTVISEARSDSVNNSLHSLFENNILDEKVGVESGSPYEIYKGIEVKNYHTPATVNDKDTLSDNGKKSSDEIKFNKYTVTCTAQLKEKSPNDSLIVSKGFVVNIDDMVKSFEDVVTNKEEMQKPEPWPSVDSQTERTENVLECQRTTFSRQRNLKETNAISLTKLSPGKYFGIDLVSNTNDADIVIESVGREKEVFVVDNTSNEMNSVSQTDNQVQGALAFDEAELNALLSGMNIPTDQWGKQNDIPVPIGDDLTTADVWKVQNFKTVTVNKQGQFVMSNDMVGSVTPGAASDEVRVDCCLMTSDGQSVVTGSSLGPPQVWDMQNGKLQNIMKGDSAGSTNLHLVCGDRLLVGAVHADMEINEYSGRKGVFNHKLQIWDFMTGRPLAMAEGEYCSAVCPMSDPDKVLFGRTDKYGDATSIIAWDLMGNEKIKEMRYDIPIGNNDYISYLNISRNDRYIVAGFTNSFDNCAEFLTFDMTQTRNIINEPSVLKMDANVECTAILPKEEAVTGLRNGDLIIWNIQTGQPSRQLLGSGSAHAHTREVQSVTLSDDSRYLVSSSADGTLKVWDMHTERPIHNLQGHGDEVWCSSISFDNEIVISGSADRTIRLWRMKNGTEMCVFSCGVNIFNVKISRDKGTIVALGDKYGARKLIMLQVVRTKIKKIVSS